MAAHKILTLALFDSEAAADTAAAALKDSGVAKHDEILNFDSGAEYVKPGMLLVGSEFQKGNLQPIPLERAPIKLSINVPGVTNATVTVAEPNVSNIQQGIATLQAGAEKTAAGAYAAQLSFEQHTVQSEEEMAYRVGVAASFNGVFASADFSAKFANENTTQKYTVVAKMLQQMYTITFAQDDFATAADFFSPSLTMADIKQSETAGYLSKDNPPVFIGSVTYGRMVVFSATSTQVSSAEELETHLQAAGASWSASADIGLAEKSFLSSLDIQVLSVGGDQAKVTNAIKSGNWSDLYSDADILSSVPLRYTVHALSGTRPIAAIGDTTKFSVADCSQVKGWYQVPGPTGVAFTDVSTNPTNVPVVALGRTIANGSVSPYRLNGETFEAVTGYGNIPVDISVEDNGNIWMLSAFGQLAYLAPGATSWNYPPATQNLNGMGSIDVGGSGFIVGLSNTYSDNQRDMYTSNSGSTWSYRVDDAQAFVHGDGPWFTTAGSLYYYVYWGTPRIESRNDANLISNILDNASEVNKIVQLSAVNGNAIYALLNNGQVGKLNASSRVFDGLTPPPAGKNLKQIEATGNGQLWGITDDGGMYRYVP